MSVKPQVSLRRTVDRKVRKVTSDLQQQLNSQPASVSVLDGVIPKGLKAGDRTFRTTPTGLALGVSDSKGNVNEVPLNRVTLQNYKPPQSAAGGPTTAQFPNSGDFGWYTNTSSGDVSFVSNIGGAITHESINLLTGSITFAQHGNLSNAGVAHNFADLSGALTSGAQHGNLGGAALHAAATTSTNGFATAAQVTLLGTLNTTLTDITSGGAVTEILNGTRLFISGVGSVTTKQAAVTTVSGSAGATYTATEQGIINALVTAVNALNSRMVTHGLIA